MREDKAIKYMSVAKNLADTFSKDPNRKVGAIFLDPESLHVLSVGYNGMPRGVDETKLNRWDRPQKYHFVSHAEINACTNACRNGTPLNNCIAIVTMFPCCDCTKALIQIGISELVTLPPNFTDNKWGDSFRISIEMLKETNIKVQLLV